MRSIWLAGFLGVGLCAGPAGATLVDSAMSPTLAVPAYSFQAGEDGTVNPFYTYTGVLGYGTLGIAYGPYFAGQADNGDPFDPAFSPPEAISGLPTSPVALTNYIDSDAYNTGNPDWQTVVEIDGNSGDEVLGGTPYGTSGFGGSIAILFSQPVQGVTLTGGYFDTVGTTAIQAFTDGGATLGSIVNLSTGYEVFNLSDDSGALIAGVVLTSTDPGGFDINGIGIAALASVPEPWAPLVLPVSVWLVVAWRRRAV